MNRQHINFDKNFNGKLFCRFFTTIRLDNIKYRVGAEYDIQLDRRDIGPGRIVSIQNFRLDKLNPVMAALDMGMTPAAAADYLKFVYAGYVQDWNQALFNFILIDMPEKIAVPYPEELYGHYEQVG